VSIACGKANPTMIAAECRPIYHGEFHVFHHKTLIVHKTALRFLSSIHFVMTEVPGPTSALFMRAIATPHFKNGGQVLEQIHFAVFPSN
ncbi:uncharacterized protein METZ01_LOCUS450806, partial [marine metagenome]